MTNKGCWNQLHAILQFVGITRWTFTTKFVWNSVFSCCNCTILRQMIKSFVRHDLLQNFTRVLFPGFDTANQQPVRKKRSQNTPYSSIQKKEDSIVPITSSRFENEDCEIVFLLSLKLISAEDRSLIALVIWCRRRRRIYGVMTDCESARIPRHYTIFRVKCCVLRVRFDQL